MRGPEKCQAPETEEAALGNSITQGFLKEAGLSLDLERRVGLQGAETWAKSWHRHQCHHSMLRRQDVHHRHGGGRGGRTGKAIWSQTEKGQSFSPSVKTPLRAATALVLRELEKPGEREGVSIKEQP